ncbi:MULTISPECIES: phosphopantothenate--cysteine ligase [Enterococcus]|uniref:phosphopantothenate--cysteine ligase n=1 Tax=Enterococcus TaxID=1350 RepID=UPI0010F7BE0C|nr:MULTISPECIES: phosphopantothenate--cysteine ligase [Enterococcus]KAF1300790.1 phosphopantothenate--cysteine ligase [Enterococcus sp. JM9B]
MRILLTAGGTSEPIDQVRAITNHSSGRLGIGLAKRLLADGAIVDYVTTATALQPLETDNLTRHIISSTNDLSQTLGKLLQKNVYDAVIHSMAVSDFTPELSLSQEEFLAAINAEVAKNPHQPLDEQRLQKLVEKLQQPTEKKISSQTSHLFLVLKQTPKVIQQIKQLQPDTLLVGFKLLVGVSKEELIHVAQENLKKNQADFILANDLESISGEQHLGYLVDSAGILAQAQTKSAIADMIVTALTKRLEEKK